MVSFAYSFQFSETQSVESYKETSRVASFGTVPANFYKILPKEQSGYQPSILYTNLANLGNNTLFYFSLIPKPSESSNSFYISLLFTLNCLLLSWGLCQGFPVTNAPHLIALLLACFNHVTDR